MGQQKKIVSLCVFQLIVFRESAGFYQVIVDAVGLDGIYQFHHRQTAADLLVLNDTFQLRLPQQKCAVAERAVAMGTECRRPRALAHLKA